MKFSICIPTLNEEKYVFRLLDSLVHQTHKDFEVIVVDAASQDKTKDVVSEYKEKLSLTLVDAPIKGIAAQRNYAASLAVNDNLIFFDADVMVDPDFLEKLARFLEERRIDIASAWNIPLTDRMIDVFMFWVFNNIYLETIKNISPGGVGTFIFATKKAFTLTKGFDETITLAEDFEFVKRAYNHGFKYALLRDPKIYFSVRRLNKEGRLRFVWKTIVGAFYYHIKGSITDPGIFKELFKHELGNHK